MAETSNQSMLEIEIIPDTVRETVSSVILTFLKKEKIKYIFGMHGGYTTGIGEELNNFPEIQFIRCQHEENAAFMADGYAKVSRIFGVLLTTAGPGLSNTFTGIISAYADGVPILHISGSVPKSKALMGAIQDTESFGMDISASFKETTRFHANISYKENFMQYFRTAIKHLFKGKKGPVMLNINSDLFSQTIEHNLEYHTHHEERYFDRNAAKNALVQLAASKSAIILAGNGVKISGGQREAEKLAEILGIPAVVTPKGKSSFNNESEFFLGVLGAGSSLRAEKYFEDEAVDTVLAIGTSFNEYSSNFWGSTLKNVKQIIQMDTDPYIIGRSFANTLGVIGDVKTALKYFIARIRTEPQKYQHLDNRPAIRKSLNEIENVVSPELMNSHAGPIKVPALLNDIYTSFSGNQCNIFNDNGSCIFWLNHYLKLKKNWNYYSSLGFSSMGYAFPASIGGALAAPDKITRAVAGDGAAVMNGNEIKTAAEYGVPVFFVVLNDGMLGIVHHSTKHLYGRPNPGLTYQSKVDFVKFAEGLGVEAYRIEQQGQINKKFIKELIKKKKPILFDCIIDPTDIGPYGNRIKQVSK